MGRPTLQAKLVDQWKLIGGYNVFEQTMVVVPSVSLDFNAPASVLQMYEERMLFLLLLLRKPGARIIYLSSMPILPDILDYYMSLLPGVIPSHARRRLNRTPLPTPRPLRGLWPSIAGCWRNWPGGDARSSRW